MFKTLKGKISLVYIGLVALTAIVGILSVLNLISLERSVDGLMANNYRSISAAQKMTQAINRQNSAIITYIGFDSQKGIDMVYDNNRVFQQSFDSASHNVTEKGERADIDSIDSNYNQFEKSFATLETVKDTQSDRAALEYYSNTLIPQIDTVGRNLQDLIAVNQAAMIRRKNSASANAGFSAYALLIVTFVAVAGGFIVSRYFVNRFLKPLHLLTEGISRVRAGGLYHQLDIRTNDETGKLAAEFNEMVKRLAQFEQSTMGTLMTEKNKSVAIVRSISDPLVVLDNSYRIVLLNVACEEFFHIHEKDMLGRHFLEAIRSGELFDLISGGKSGPAGKIVRFQQEGAACYFNAVVTPVTNQAGTTDGFILLLQNVTRLKELERTKADFFATVSHEFKTPLTSITMGASMLAGNRLGTLTGDQADIVGAIEEDADRLTGFVNELLEISRMESGKTLYSFAPCSMNAIAENSIRQFAVRAQQNGVLLQNRLSENLPLVRADFERITWVVNNLLSNALKYTGDGDSVTVRAKVTDRYLETAVEDTGEGIPEEYLQTIFSKFVQVPGQDLEVRGTGLGLAVAKEIITAHGGTIRAESEIGRGSVFRFTLPIWKEPACDTQTRPIVERKQ